MFEYQTKPAKPEVLEVNFGCGVACAFKQASLFAKYADTGTCTKNQGEKVEKIESVQKKKKKTQLGKYPDIS